MSEELLVDHQLGVVDRGALELRLVGEGGQAVLGALLVQQAERGGGDLIEVLGVRLRLGARARGERKRPSAGWESLTPTELRVVGLTAAGLTNPQIAERMFIARGTVKVHLSHVFAKVGVATRAELAAQATKRGLAET